MVVESFPMVAGEKDLNSRGPGAFLPSLMTQVFNDPTHRDHRFHPAGATASTGAPELTYTLQ